MEGASDSVAAPHDAAALEPVTAVNNRTTEQHVNDSALAEAQDEAQQLAHAQAQEVADAEGAAQLQSVDLSNPPTASDIGMDVELNPPTDISLEESVVKYPVPIHTPDKPWNRPPKGPFESFIDHFISRA